MDTVLLGIVGDKLIDKKIKQNEEYKNAELTPAANGNVEVKKSNTLTILSTLFGLFIGFSSAYLSWTCNTALGISTGMKVLYAIFAFLFGLIYLIFYLIFRAGTCSTAKNSLQPAAVQQPGGKMKR